MNKDQDIALLNENYSPLNPIERIANLFRDFPEDKVLLTSSFGTSSVYLLYLTNIVRPGHKVHFLDTRYHFAETVHYKEELQQLYHLNVIDVVPEETDTTFTSENKTWLSEPDRCCEVNKVKPLSALKAKHTVWITGVRKDQTEERTRKAIFEFDGEILKFHPIIDVHHDEVRAFAFEHRLPQHPLLSKGYESIGCKYCTLPGIGRAGRWSGTDKNECGLHVNLEPQRIG